MAKIIEKGLAKANSEMLLNSSLVAPVMKFPKSMKTTNKSGQKIKATD